MTLQKYWHQKDPKKLPIASVEVKYEECYRVFPVFGGFIATLLSHCGYFQYFIPNGHTTMYTMDEDGNKKNPTVFKLIDL